MDRKITHAEYQKLQREAALSRERNGEIKRLNRLVNSIRQDSEDASKRHENLYNRYIKLVTKECKMRDVVFTPFRWPRSKIKELKQIVNG